MRPSFSSFPSPSADSPVARLLRHVRSLSPGDRFIAAILTLLVLISLLVGARALQRQFLVEVPARGGTLVEGVVGSPRFVNPLLALTDADRDLAALTYAGLMRVNAEGDIVPSLAEGYTVSEDGREYVFTIRTDARFSDGSPVTAEDVVFTVERAQDPTLRSPEIANWANIRAEAVDARTVRFILPRPYAPFLADTTLGILPADHWRNIPSDEFSFSPLMQHPIGAGPYKVTRIDRARDGSISSYTLRANDTYLPHRPYLTTIRVRFYEDTLALLEAYEDEEVDSAYGIPVDTALSAPYSRVFGAFYNSEQEPALSDQAVREALSRAIDRDAIVTGILGGHATPLVGPVPPGSGITIPTPDPEDGIERAVEVLTDAGWERDAETGLWSDGEDTLETMVIRTSNVPELRAVASAIERDWDALGVPTDVEVFEPGDLALSVIRPRDYDVLLFGMVIGRDRDLYAFWDSGERSDPGLNVAQYANREVDALLESIREEQDQEVARAQLAEAAELIASEYPAAFTHAPNFLYAVPNSVHGIRLPQIAAPSDRFADVAEWYRNTERVWPAFARE